MELISRVLVEGPVRRVRIHPRLHHVYVLEESGHSLVVGVLDAELRVTHLRRIPLGEQGVAIDLAVHPREPTVWLTGVGRCIERWDTERGEKTAEVGAVQRVTMAGVWEGYAALAVDTEGGLALAANHATEKLEVIDLQTGKLVSLQSGQPLQTAVALHPTGRVWANVMAGTEASSTTLMEIGRASCREREL